jgi:hypothetical protein
LAQHARDGEREPPPARGTEPTGESERTVSALTPAGLLLGVLCVAITCCVVCYAELVVGKIQIGFLQLPPVVVGMLVLLLGAQALLSRLSGRLKLQPRELFTIYVMMLLAAMISSRGLLQKLIPLLVVPNYDATAENGWPAKFFPYIKSWSVPWNPAGAPKQFVTARFFDALRPGEKIPWGMWVVPLCAWGVFVALMFTSFLCLAVLLRRQWVDNEKLAFPLVQLPLEMIRGDSASAGPLAGGSFLKNGITWFGVAAAACLFGLKGLHQYAPSFPDVVTDVDLNALFTHPPANQMGFFHIYLSLAAIGFFYLLPTDLLFSLWFFFLLTKVEEVGAASLGYEAETMPMYGCKTFVGYQIIGAYIVLVGYMVYSARPHIRRIWRAATSLRRLSAADRGADELIPYRAAFWGLAGSVLLSAGWLTLLGMSYWLALFELLVLLFVVALVMARSVCESGMLMTETSWRPIDLYRMVGDVRNLGAANLTGLAFLDGLWMRDQRGLILTGFLDSMKFADGVRVRRRSLAGVFGVAFLVAILVAGYLHVSLPYKLGAVQMYSYVYRGNPVWAFTNAATVMDRSQPPLPFFATMNFFVGALITFLIGTLRTRLLWFPLHPLAYALSGSWTMMVFWFPCFVAWLCKVVILRYGGMKLYARARPFFLGLVLGEFTTAIAFTIPALFNRYTPTPDFPWP